MGEVPAQPPTSVPRAAETPWSGKPAPRRMLRLPLKATIAVLTLLIVVVGVCGVIFQHITESLLQQSRETQVVQFASGVASTLGATGTNEPQVLEKVLAGLQQTPNLDFAMVTDREFQPLARMAVDAPTLHVFERSLHRVQSALPSRLEKVAAMPVRNGHSTLVFSMPILRRNAEAKTTLQGYLHVGFSNDVSARLRILQGLILLACMGVVIVAMPIATLIARHITVPIGALAAAAHKLAEGKLDHRVDLLRQDELGELADAFNRMAHTVQTQQEDIRRINSELEQKVHDRTAQLEKVNSRLKAEIAEKEDFLRAVSHDLNAPLRNISGMASMLLLKYKDTLEADALQRLERIQKNVEVECELIGELLELSRIKTRREKIEAVDLHELIAQVAEGFSSDFETRRISFHITGRLPVMNAERSRMRQVFQNLIDNAVKYMRDDGPREIHVTLRWEREDLVISVSDTGMGIAPEDLPHLFHVFRRAKNATAMKIPGKGVGLASVKSIVENYAGRLWAESQPGVGTTFHMAIPRHCFAQVQEVAA